MDKKQKFYIFLDIDGVMWDWNYLKQVETKANTIVRADSVLNPKSVQALNALIATLDNAYDTRLVVSSSWRNVKAKRENNYMLYDYGLKYNKPIDHTILRSDMDRPYTRGQEIEDYLDKHMVSAMHGDYVIIDDEMDTLKPYQNAGKVIETSMSKGLSMDHIRDFLRDNPDLQELAKDCM
jgi:hypothetical protein